MPADASEYFTKVQEESLQALKQVQDANLTALKLFQESAADTIAYFTKLQEETARQWVTTTFAVASELLKVQKGYALKIAELVAAGQERPIVPPVRAEDTRPDTEVRPDEDMQPKDVRPERELISVP